MTLFADDPNPPSAAGGAPAAVASVATTVATPPVAAPGAPTAPVAVSPRRPGSSGAGRGDGLLALAIAAVLVATAFVGGGGQRLGEASSVAVGLVVLGALVAIAAVLAGGRGPLHGGSALVALGALAVLTTLSVTWSLSPGDSWLEATRTLSYLAVFGGAMALVRLAPHRWPAVLHGIALACVTISTWSLLTKVAPEAVAPDEVFARIRAPFGYWNAAGLMAALGVPPLLWLAARRTGHAPVNALAWPGLGIVLACLLLSYSRGALLALLAGLLCWFVLVPLRLRSAAALLGAALAAALPVGFAFSQDALTEDLLPAAVRSDAGAELGALLALMVAVLLAAGLAVTFAVDRTPARPRARRRAGWALVALLVLLPAAGITALAASPGGIAGQFETGWEQLTDPDAETPANRPDRLTDTASVRARYWSEALEVHADHPWLGTGAGAYPVARTRYREDPLEVRHAHGYAVQTLSDLGWAGLALSLAAALAWLVAAARSTGAGRRRTPPGAEETGLLAMAAVVVIFAVHSLVDWTWFVPANAAVALLCAGWVAGRGRVAPRGGAISTAAATAPALPPTALDDVPHSRGVAQRAAAVLGIAILAGTACWAALVPVRAQALGDRAIAAFERGELDRAAGLARQSIDADPLAVEPLWELASIELARGRPEAAEAALEAAVDLQPARSQTWTRLGRFRIANGRDPEGALRAFRAAYHVDPASKGTASDVLEARRFIATIGG